MTSSSLPGLLGEGGLGETLVLWCGKDTASETAAEFANVVSSGLQSDFQYAWLNGYINEFNVLLLNFSESLFFSSRYPRLIAHLLPTAASLPSVLAVNLQQVHHILFCSSPAAELCSLYPAACCLPPPCQ